jgi:phage terminase small subunit
MSKDGELQTVSAYEAALNKLTAKQAEFVREYLLDNNGTQAAIRAKYSEKSAQQIGTENLSKPLVRAAVEAGRAEMQEHRDYSRDWVINQLVQDHHLALQGNPVVDRYGKPTGQVMRQLPSSIKALEVVSNLLGYSVDRKAVMVMNVKSMGEQELADAEEELEREIAKLEGSSTNSRQE